MKVLLLPFAQVHRNRNLGEAGGFYLLWRKQPRL